MKKIFLILMIAIFANVVHAQSQNTESKMTRKEQQKAEMEQQYKITKQMLEDRNFVVESDYLQDRYGNRVLVNSTINFVKVDGDTAVIQIGSNHGVGPNGVGGVTAKGRITKWDLTENVKRKTFHLQMNVMTTIGIYNVDFMVGGNGKTLATLTSVQPGRLTFEGDLVTLDKSVVYEGYSL